MYPESLSDKTLALVGVVIIVTEIRQFLKWITEDDIKDIEVKEPKYVSVIGNKESSENKEYDGGDDFKTFKANNGIID